MGDTRTVQELVGLWQQRLNLGHWRITVREDASLWDSGVGMETEANVKYRRAIIAYDPKILVHDQESPEDTDTTICFRHGSLEFNVIHELMHVMVAEFSAEAKDAATLVGAINHDRGEMIADYLQFHEERLCDALATVIEWGCK